VPCEEKYRLLNLYKASVTAHSTAAHDLSLTRWQTPKHEYERLWQTAEKARTETEVASRALFQHTREHGC
jgi:hypothetical protein